MLNCGNKKNTNLFVMLLKNTTISPDICKGKCGCMFRGDFRFSVARLAKQLISFNELVTPLVQSQPKYTHSYGAKF